MQRSNWLLVGVFIFFSRPVFADRIQMSYEGFLGPLFVISGVVELNLSAVSYEVKTTSTTEGFGAWFFPWRNESVSVGMNINGEIHPKKFQMKAKWNHRERDVELLFGNLYPEIKKITPPSTMVENTLVQTGLTSATIDPLSMAVKLMIKMGRAERCPGKIRVFDGRRRYDLSFSEAIGKELEKKAPTILGGITRSCAMSIERIAGFWKESKIITETKGPPRIWLGRLAKELPMVPVKFEANYRFGVIRIYLTAFKAGSIIRKLD